MASVTQQSISMVSQGSYPAWDSTFFHRTDLGTCLGQITRGLCGSVCSVGKVSRRYEVLTTAVFSQGLRLVTTLVMLMLNTQV